MTGRRLGAGRPPEAVRHAVLRAANWRCQIQGPRCQGHADCVDHVIPYIDGGSDDPSNLRAACTTCNSGRRSTTTVATRSVTKW